MDEQIIGVWKGHFEGQLVNGQSIQPGDTAEITEADLESGHWERADSNAVVDEPPLAELHAPEPIFEPPPSLTFTGDDDTGEASS